MVKKLLRRFSSIKLAAVLILMLCVLGLIGILVPQVPSAFAASSEGYAWWVENVAYDQLGTMAYTLVTLGFFNIFHSVWFVGTAALLLLSILICTVSRFGALKTKAEKASVVPDTEFYQNVPYAYTLKTPSSVKEMGEAAFNTLEDRGYSISKSENPEMILLSGDKHRFAPYGTLLVHLSLIVLIVGVIIGIFFGFRNDNFVIGEGTVKSIGFNTGLTVGLQSFTDTYWEDGSPKDFSSEVVLFENDVAVESGVIRVNHPMRYKGIRLHQGYFGQAAALQISDESGSVIYADSVPLTDVQENEGLQRPAGEAELPDNHYHIILLGHALNGDDPYIGENQLGVEFYDENMEFMGWLVLSQNMPQTLGDLNFKYNSAQYSGLMISKEPGTVFIWIAAVLFLAGLFMLFYLPHRRIWVKLQTFEENSTMIQVRLESSVDLGAAGEASAIMKALGTVEAGEGGNHIES